MLRERGNGLGFTQLPKFTYWESLTPVPLNLIWAVEPLSLNKLNIPDKILFGYPVTIRNQSESFQYSFIAITPLCVLLFIGYKFLRFLLFGLTTIPSVGI